MVDTVTSWLPIGQVVYLLHYSSGAWRDVWTVLADEYGNFDQVCGDELEVVSEVPAWLTTGEVAVQLRASRLLSALTPPGTDRLLFEDNVFDIGDGLRRILPACVSVETMLAAIKNTLGYGCTARCRRTCERNDFYRSACARLARLDAFATLCTAKHAALAPGRALTLAKEAMDAAHKKSQRKAGLDEGNYVEACLAEKVEERGTSVRIHASRTHARSGRAPPRMVRMSHSSRA